MTLATGYILVGVLAGATGEILLKHGMNQVGVVTLSLHDLVGVLWRMGTNPFVLGGLALYVGGALFWLAALSRVDLSYAYPFASLSYIVMLIASWQLLSEQITPPRVIGTMIIAAGVFVISRGG